MLCLDFRAARYLFLSPLCLSPISNHFMLARHICVPNTNTLLLYELYLPWLRQQAVMVFARVKLRCQYDASKIGSIHVDFVSGFSS